MKIGDVVPTKSLRIVIPEGGGWVDFKPPKGRQFVLLLLGDEPTNGPALDPVAALTQLGWEPARNAASIRSLGKVKP